ncbi:hypothetical protein [Marinagarivorans algicola]|uniref:hypothetical protein n=1 Tax=Marinagarivorans algicola TaxID=1513270 RepID=UPI0006B5B1AE|nr:hypothetical protein [Marinagarivorans algicola]
MNQSREISSSQQGLHEHLESIVLKHMAHPFQKPVQLHNQQAFEAFLQVKQRLNLEGMLLDSCCGTGLSSYRLACANPNKLVVGLDQSQSRLTRDTEHLHNLPANCLLLRANCEDFWRLCVEHGITFDKHSILYPNPYPKAKHFQRRWHGHAAFPLLNALAPVIEVRSNWLIYIEEFAAAWQLLTGQKGTIAEIHPRKALTLFEKKYAASGQALWGFGNGAFYTID